ncbi:MAG TPA: metallophosphoesterase family protein [Thermoleophilaceae bacterium]
MRTIRSALAVALVVIAVLGGGLLALATYSAERDLSVGRIELSVEPFHPGALDLYVPLVDWGARFSAVRLPARLKIDVRTVDRDAAERVANGELPDVRAVRHEARDAVAAYIRVLLMVVFLCALAAGVIVALAVRGRGAPRLRWLFAAAGGTALAGVLALFLLLPPRGEIADPEYYANGPDIPVALRTIERAQGSAKAISEELNQQLVGLAQLISSSSSRQPPSELRSAVIASDLHNNLLALPALDRAVGSRPLFFVGDLTSSGSPFEFNLVRRVVRIGHPFVFVSGNHDSDALVRRMALAGGIVLTQRGRLRADGGYGPVVVRVRGLRVAGYADPFERKASERFKGTNEPTPDAAQREAFRDWLRPLLGHVDVVMVHEPQLARDAAEELRRIPPNRPLVLLTGHTHMASFHTSTNFTEINGGTVGGGGTGNFEKNQPFGLALLSYTREDGFQPAAADLVEIDAHGGSARAQRFRIGE